ncbi:hypothetical protein M885DRAFT_606050, partial [Pelagophyceae sp. CCMP2097]
QLVRSFTGPIRRACSRPTASIGRTPSFSVDALTETMGVASGFKARSAAMRAIWSSLTKRFDPACTWLLTLTSSSWSLAVQPASSGGLCLLRAASAVDAEPTTNATTPAAARCANIRMPAPMRSCMLAKATEQAAARRRRKTKVTSKIFKRR